MRVTGGQGAERVADLVARLRSAGCVFAEEEAALLVEAARDQAELDRLADERVAGRPLEVLLGWAEFAGLRVGVAPGVFVPRRRSELLVDRSVALARSRGWPAPVVLDLCCGTGALGLALARALERGDDPGPAEAFGREGTLARVEVWAVDRDPVAVACARTNLAPVGGHVLCGDLYAPLPPELAGRVDLLVAVTPYVPTDAVALMPPEAREHEPRAALDGGPDGLAVLRRLAAGAPALLAPGGAVVTEVGESQVDPAGAALAAAGLRVEVAHDAGTGGTAVPGHAPG